MIKMLLLFIAVLIAGPANAEWIDPTDLRVGQTYVLSRQTPLVPAPGLGQHQYRSTEHVERAVHLPPGARITVNRSLRVNNMAWYDATARSSTGSLLGRGFIIDSALMGQQLTGAP
jgi:hypothetical protein